MYKCNSCGEVFDEAKIFRETHGFTDGKFENICACPSCGGSYSEAKQCKNCGDWHFEDELFGGLCCDCLTDKVDYITAYDYLKSIEDALNVFIFEKWLDSLVPQKTNEKIDFLCSRLYWEAVNEERGAKCDTLLKKLRSYIIDNDGDLGKCDFAEWLERREV